MMNAANLPTTGATMAPSIISLYSTLTEKVGFGLFSSLQLRRDGGLTWGQIHALTDAGLIRPVGCVGSDVSYRLLFP